MNNYKIHCWCNPNAPGPFKRRSLKYRLGSLIIKKKYIYIHWKITPKEEHAGIYPKTSKVILTEKTHTEVTGGPVPMMTNTRMWQGLQNVTSTNSSEEGVCHFYWKHQRNLISTEFQCPSFVMMYCDTVYKTFSFNTNEVSTLFTTFKR